MLQILKTIFKRKTMDYKALIARGAIIIDVRSQVEYNTGHIRGSLNVPVDSIKNRIPDLKQRGTPIITVCKSGSRSSLATSMLSAAGIEAYNGGPWNSLQTKL